MKKKEIIILLSLFIISFLVRFVCLQQIKDNPFFRNPIIDAAGYNHAAVNIAEGGKTLDNSSSFYQAPFYTYFLALIYKILGKNLYVARIFQIFVSSLSCILIFLLAKTIFSKKIAVLSAVVYIFYGTIVLYDIQLLKPFLVVFLNLLGIYLLIKSVEKQKYIMWFIAGVVFGLSIITRENTLLFIPFVIIWMWISLRKEKNHKKMWMCMAGFCAGIVLIVGAMTIRNYSIEKDAVLVSKTGGLNFYIGNTEKTDYYLSLQPGYEWSKLSNLPYEKEGYQLKSSEWSSWYFKETFNYIINNPFKWGKIIIKKFMVFWNGYEYDPNYDIDYIKSYSPVLRVLLFKLFGVFFPFGIIAPLAVLGIVMLIKNKNYSKEILLLYFYLISYVSSVILFLVKARYRIPIIPVFIMLSLYAIYEILKLISKKDYKTFIKSLFLLIVFIFFMNYDFLGNSINNKFPNHYYLARSYVKMKNNEKAMEEFRLAIKQYPGSTESHNELARVYLEKNMVEEALVECEKSLELSPDFSEAHATMGLIYDKQNKHREAIKEYEKSIDYANKLTDFPGIYYNLGNAYFKLKMYDEAVSAFNKTLEYDSNRIRAIQNIGAIYALKGMYTEAEKVYLKAIDMNGNCYEFHYNLGIIYKDMKQYDKAIREFRIAGRISPNMLDIQNIIDDISQKKKVRVVMNETEPELYNNIKMYVERASEYAEKNDYENAIRELEKAIIIQPNNYNIHYNMGVLYWKLEKWSKAIAEFEQVKIINPEHGNIEKYINEAKKKIADN